MREDLIALFAKIAQTATIANYQHIGYKVLFDTVLTADDINKINELCKKYTYRWMLSILNGRFCLTIFNK